jgi:arylformamidase
VSHLDREYSPSSRLGGSSDPFIANYQQRSEQAGASLEARVLRLEGGSLLVSAGADAPVLAFVHGGYWQALSAADSLFPAPALHALGWSYLAVEYSLAPHASLDQMVQQCRNSLATMAEELPDRGKVVLAGHSAGAHLAAMTALVQAPPLAVERLVLVSGVYDLRPLVHTTVNDVLGLDDADAARLSPALATANGDSEVVVVWGDNETESFKAQSRAYAAHVRHHGLRAIEVECVGRHHFDIVDDLGDPSSTLGALTLG